MGLKLGCSMCSKYEIVKWVLNRIFATTSDEVIKMASTVIREVPELVFSPNNIRNLLL
jgi:hypothetical protein